MEDDPSKVDVVVSGDEMTVTPKEGEVLEAEDAPGVAINVNEEETAVESPNAKYSDPAYKHRRAVLRKIRHGIFLVFIILLPVSWFLKDRFKSIDFILPQSIPAPEQIPIENQKPIVFMRNGYSYELTPLYDYSLNGLILHTQRYDTWYSISRTDKTFTKDVCMAWGDMLRQGTYKDSTLKVKQDFRFCLFSYTNPGLVFNGDEFSNSHLIASTPDIEWKIRSLEGGDQVRITGKLVNVKAVATGETDSYERPEITWHTSVNRIDTGAGACEVIYVESVDILSRGNTAFRVLYTMSFYGLILIAIWTVIAFFIDIKRFQ